jgi:hypothetical protein
VGPGIHFFDIAKAGNGTLVLVGSRPRSDGTGEAVAYVSSDNGKTWKVGVSDNATGGYGRYYWAVTVGGKVYLQCAHGQNMPLRVFDGTNWSTIDTGGAELGIVYGKDVEAFLGSAYTTSGYTLTSKGISYNGQRFVDLHNDGAQMYTLGFDGTISVSNGRTKGKNKELALTTVFAGGFTTEKLTSIAAADGVVYAGTQTGNVLALTP